jgi:hypothetical protein
MNIKTRIVSKKRMTKRKNSTIFNNPKKRKMKNPCVCKKANAVFNIPGQTRGIWCRHCPTRAPNAVDVVNKKCKCGKHQPTYNLPTETKAIYCKFCKPVGAVDVKHRKCKCKKHRPTFCGPEDTIPIWCLDCREDNYINCVNKMCEVCNEVIPIFGMPGDKKPRWCRDCKSDDAVDVVHSLCVCKSARPTFGLLGEKAIWCINCPALDPNAINVVNDLCACGKRAYYNLEDEKQPIWCSDCKSDDAVLLFKTKCECQKSRPTFGNVGDTKAKWCLHCPTKPPDAVDVTHTFCECGTRASYGIPGSSPTSCSTHKISGMVTLPTKKCEFSQCKELALFGSKDRQRCDTHKFATDLNLVEKPCVSCGLDNVLNSNTKCYFCEPNTFLRIQKQKETRIRDFLIANNIPFTQDQIPNGTECGKERPDFVIYFKTHVIIIEVDENQHKGYACECEQIRMINLTQAFCGLPVFWIRYNPDVFKLPNEKKSKISQSNREEHLLDWINFASTHISTHLGKVVYLFFDGCNEKQGEENIVLLPNI